MAELLTRAIAEEYRKRAKALPDTAGQDIRERREPMRNNGITGS